MVQIIDFKQTATSSYRWFTFMPEISSLWRPTGLCNWPFSVLFIYNVNKSNNNFIITNHDVSHHIYADDTHVYIELSQSDTHKSISSLSDCLTDISLWMISSKLKTIQIKVKYRVCFAPVLITNHKLYMCLASICLQN